jgi:hypothetical protein
MTKHRPSPTKAEGREQQFEKLLAATGMGEDPHARYAFTHGLELIEHQSARWIAASGKQTDLDLVQRYRASLAKALALSEEVGSDFLANEIQKASLSRLNPDIDENTLQTLMIDHEHRHTDVLAVLTAHGLDIDHWVEINGASYKKRNLRKLVIEPFLQLMSEHGIATSRKQRPRKQIFDALFDWLGIEQKYRPSSANIDAIARELERRAP